MYKKIKILGDILENSKIFKNLHIILVEGTECSGKSAWIQNYLEQNGSNNIEVISDWTFLRNSDDTFAKKYILSLGDEERFYFLAALRKRQLKYLNSLNDFVDFKKGRREEKKILLIDRGIFSTIVLHQESISRKMLAIEHFIPDEVIFMDTDPLEIEKRSFKREVKNKMDEIDLKEITKQQKEFKLLYNFYNIYMEGREQKQ